MAKKSITTQLKDLVIAYQSAPANSAAKAKADYIEGLRNLLNNCDANEFLDAIRAINKDSIDRKGVRNNNCSKLTYEVLNEVLVKLKDSESEIAKRLGLDLKRDALKLDELIKQAQITLNNLNDQINAKQTELGNANTELKTINEEIDKNNKVKVETEKIVKKIAQVNVLKDDELTDSKYKELFKNKKEETTYKLAVKVFEARKLIARGSDVDPEVIAELKEIQTAAMLSNNLINTAMEYLRIETDDEEDKAKKEALKAEVEAQYAKTQGKTAEDGSAIEPEIKLSEEVLKLVENSYNNALEIIDNADVFGDTATELYLVKTEKGKLEKEVGELKTKVSEQDFKITGLDANLTEKSEQLEATQQEVKKVRKVNKILKVVGAAAAILLLGHAVGSGISHHNKINKLEDEVAQQKEVIGDQEQIIGDQEQIIGDQQIVITNVTKKMEETFEYLNLGAEYLANEDGKVIYLGDEYEITLSEQGISKYNSSIAETVSYSLDSDYVEYTDFADYSSAHDFIMGYADKVIVTKVDEVNNWVETLDDYVDNYNSEYGTTLQYTPEDVSVIIDGLKDDISELSAQSDELAAYKDAAAGILDEGEENTAENVKTSIEDTQAAIDELEAKCEEWQAKYEALASGSANGNQSTNKTPEAENGNVSESGNSSLGDQSETDLDMLPNMK